MAEGNAEIAIGGGMIGGDLNGVFECLDGLGKAAGGAVGDTEVTVSIRGIGIEANGFVIEGDRVVHAIWPARQHQAKTVGGLGRGGRGGGDRLPDHFLGDIVAVALVCQHAQEMRRQSG